MTQLAKSTDALPVHEDAASRAIALPNPRLDQLSFNKATGQVERWNGSEWTLALGNGAIYPVVGSAAERDALFPAPSIDQRVHRKDTGAVERWTGTAWVVDLQSGTALTVAVTGAARDALFPAPAANTRVQRTDYGAIERYTGAAWVADTSSKTHENPIAKGADPAGVAGSASAFTQTLALGRDVYVTKGTYLIDADVTVTSTIRFEQGAVLKIASGKTVRFQAGAHIDAGQWQIFDFSLGGTVSFVGSQIDEVKGFWYGIVADGVTDNGTILNLIEPSLDQGMRVRFPLGNYVIASSQTWVFRNRQGIIVDTGADPLQGGQCPQLKWIGPTGGRQVLFHTMSHSYFMGFQLDPGAYGTGAGVGIDCDGYGGNRVTFGATLSTTAGSRTVTDSANGFTAVTKGQYIEIAGAGPGGSLFKGFIVDRTGATATLDPGLPAPATTTVNTTGATEVNGGIGTACTFERNVASGATPDGVGIRISNTVTNNQEYHYVRRNVLSGAYFGSHQDYMVGEILAGSLDTVRITNGRATYPNQVGASVYIVGAGAAGAIHRTTIASYVDNSHFTLTTPAVTAVAAGARIFISAQGIGIQIGASANAKRIEIEDNQIVNAKQGIQVLGGSAHFKFNSFTSNDVNIDVQNTSEPCMDLGSNSEYSAQHLSYNGQPLTVMAPRCDISNAPYADSALSGTDAYFGGSTQSKIAFFSVALENALPPGAQMFSAFGITVDGIRFGVPVTLSQLAAGASPLNFPFVLKHSVNVTDAPNGQLMAPVLYAAANDQFDGAVGAPALGTGAGGAVVGHTKSASNGNTDYVGVHGIATHDNGGGVGNWNIGVRASTGTLNSGLNNANFRGLDIELPVTGDGTTATAAEASRVHSPILTAGSIINLMRGHVTEPLRVPGVNGAVVVTYDQQGSRELNRFAGAFLIGDSGVSTVAAPLDVYGGVRTRKVSEVGAVTVTPQGTPGTTTYNYWVVAVDTAGRETLPVAGSTSTGAAPLGSANFNRLTWAHVPGAAFYRVLRNTTGSFAVGGDIVPAPVGGGTVTFDDVNVGVTGSYTPVTRNATGDSQIDGLLTASGAVARAKQAISVAAAGTAAIDCTLGSVVRITAAGDFTMADPTNPTDGQELEVEIFNNTAGAIAITQAPSFAVAIAPPATTKRTVVRVRYDATGGRNKWSPITPQVPDYP